MNEFAQESHDTIIRQIKRLGSSLDWTREAYTLDERRNFGVRTAFKKMYDLGLIYRGNRIVNWDPKGQTVISDDEVLHEERTAKLYTFRYDKNFPIAIATTRLETKFGDTAVAVHPDDPRYTKFVGKEYDADFCGTPIHVKVIADRSVEKDFGTGALGITPAHSMIDAEIAERHGLPQVQVVNEYGKMTVAGPVHDKKTEEAREWVAEELRKQGLIEKEEEIAQNVSIAERTGAIIEPLPKLQWFVAVSKPFKRGLFRKTTLKKLMRDAVAGGGITITPGRFEKIYFHWIDNLRDWCISRQIWFGHQVPAFYDLSDEKNEGIAVFPHGIDDQGFLIKKPEEELNLSFGVVTRGKTETVIHSTDFKSLRNLVKQNLTSWKEIKSKLIRVDAEESTPIVDISDISSPSIVQDSDTLDTWFSSALWPFSTLGWPHFAETASRGKPGPENDFANYFPNSLMAPGYEILQLWVARMILMSGVLLNSIPFKTVLIHGIVRDSKGEKFSKSKGNGIDPLILADTYGADALRMALIVGAAPGNDVKFDEQRVKGYRNFSTKIWNVARFIEMNKPVAPSVALAEARTHVPSTTSVIPAKAGIQVSSETHKKYLSDLAALKKEVTAHLDNFEFHLAAEKLYHYVWHELADVIIEAEKEKLRNGTDEEKAASYAVLEQLLLESLKMLHPFMPFITEEIYQIFRPGKMLMVEKW